MSGSQDLNPRLSDAKDCALSHYDYISLKKMYLNLSALFKNIQKKNH